MEDSDEENSNSSNQIIFVAIIKKYPVIFNKSQSGGVKVKKAEAYTEIRNKFNAAFGSDMTVQQIMKKLHNMKTRIKNKTDLRKMKNKKIRLKSWEADFFKLMQGVDIQETSYDGVVDENDDDDGEDTEFIETEGSRSWFEQFTTYVSCATDPSQALATGTSSETVEETPGQTAVDNEHTPETEETRNLSLGELQRLVLLEQLQVLKLLKERLLKKK